MRILIGFLLTALVSACSDNPPSTVQNSKQALVFWIDDGVEGDFGKIEGDLSGEVPSPASNRDMLIRAVGNCVPSYSVHGNYSHTTMASVDLEGFVPERNEVFQCVKSRMAGRFNAAIGDPEAFETFDDTAFEDYQDFERK